jgi:hypothetical protein
MLLAYQSADADPRAVVPEHVACVRALPDLLLSA